MSKRKGIKRHEALQPLSRHHMEGLLMGVKLARTGLEQSKLSVEEIIAETKTFWEPKGQAHFREEEDYLLPAYAEFAEINQPIIVEMLLEHITIRSKMNQVIKGELTEIEMRELGELLQGHIRQEERVIFPMIEKALPEERLLALAPYIHD